ncbi:MAG: tRNA uridine-5-carboxymethylaminomethyl(34) synthesis GTPase MnmE, partial [Planctomycetota bacterium]
MIGDTIFAVASPPGSGPRAVMRLSGPLARRAAAAVFAPALPVERAQVEGFVRVGRFQVEAFALHMPSPRSYTGEDV